MSPAAYTRGLDVCSRSSTSTPCGVWRTPAASRFIDASSGTRPVEISTVSPSTRLTVPPRSRCTRFTPPCSSTRVVVVPRCRVMPSASKRRVITMLASGSSGQQPRLLADQRHARAEPAERLRQLAPDGASAQHHQPLGQRGEGEHRLVGEVARLLEPRNGGHRWLPSRGDQGPREGEALALHLDGILRDEAALAEEHVHAQPLEALGRVVVGDAGAQRAHPLHHLARSPPGAHWPPRRKRAPRARWRPRAPSG